MERKELIAKAEGLGIEFRKNISTAELDEMVLQAESDKEIEAKSKEIETRTKDIPKVEIDPATLDMGARKAYERKRASRLVRCIVSSMDKDKAELEGEIISTANSLTGVIKKMIPFGREWHIPQMLVETLQEKRMLATRDRRTPKGVVKDNIEVPAYNVVILPDLTQEELDELSKQ